MNRIFLLISAVGVLLISCKDEDIVFSSECYPEHLREGVLVSYSFNNGSLENGTSFNADLVPNAGPIPAPDRFGNPNCAYFFDTNPSFPTLETSNSSFLNDLNQFSVSLWYQPQDSFHHGGSIEGLLGRNKTQDQCPDRIGEWSIGLHDCRRVVFGHNNSVWEDIALPPGGCHELVYSLTGTWHHVVAIYTEEYYKIYKDGILQDSVSGLASCTNLQLAEDVGDLIIGYKFTGKIDDILIYNRALSATEVSELYSNDPCCQP
jgi:hypothetical protein